MKAQRQSIITITVGLLALGTAVFAQTNNAQYLGDTIPTTMIPGFTYNITVTMKNTGTTTWTAAGNYHLGASGNSDPFAPGRIHLESGDSMAPGQQRTFGFTMLAPSAGSYTTDWRMVQDGVEWFGDTLTKQVSVTFGPSPPGAPTITWPTHGMVLGSNRPDIVFQGDPSDGYEVHIGSYNVPASNNGWDSGFVSLNPGPDPVSAMSGVLNPEAYYYVFVRLHNPNGWGPWSAAGDSFYTDGQLLNDPYLVSGGGLQWLDSVCYNPDRNEYLITWQNGYIIHWRRLDSTGANIGSDVILADDLPGHHQSVVCYNSVRKEYLIEYWGWTPSDSNEVRVLRVDAATGNPIGGPIWIGSAGIVFAAAVSYSPENNSYLATWQDYTPGGCVFGRRLDATGVPTTPATRINASQYLYSRNESIAYNSTNDEYMVTFQGLLDEPHDMDVIGQRVRASDGSLIGSNIVIAGELGGEGPGGIAYDSDMNRYLVVYDFGPTGQFVSASGTLIGGKFAVGPGTGFFFGGMSNVGWNPVTKEYLATFASWSSYSDLGQRISQTGACLGEPFTTNGNQIGFGNWPSMPVYNSVNNEFLIHWYNSYTNVLTRRYKSFPLPPVDTTPPGPVTDFNVASGDGQLTLSWTNPSDADFAGTMIRWNVGGYPTSIYDGTLLVDRPNIPGSTDNYTHSGLSGGTTYSYAAFAYDRVPLYSTAVNRSGTPSGDRVIAIYPFDSGTDAWSTATWKTGSYDPGTITWWSGAGSSGGGMRATGSGSTDNNSRETREGGEMWNTISTVGFDRIKVVYDLRASTLGTAYYGSGGGDPNAHPDHEDVQEQLTVSYRTSSGGSWTEAAPWLGRDILLGYQSYGTRTIDLTGLPGVDSCSQFGLKFRWQFNTANDAGDLDNITVRGYRMENVNPTIGITGPTSDSKCPANATPFAISGWASDNVAVTQVSWSNNRGGSGVCSGSAWWDASVPLFSGQNNITVVARDAAGNMATDSVLVTYVPGAPVSIAGAKSVANDINVYVAGKQVSAVYSDCLYIQETDRMMGIKVKPLVMPAAIEVGKKIDFGGSVKSETTGERYLYGPILIVN